MATVTWEVSKDEYRVGCWVAYSKPQNLADSTEMVQRPVIADTPGRLVCRIQKPSHRRRMLGRGVCVEWSWQQGAISDERSE